MSSREQKRASRRDKRKKKSCLKMGICILTLICLLLISAIVVLSIYRNDQTFLVCKSGFSVKPRDEITPGVFDSLTFQEYNGVKDFLFKRANLSLVNFEKAYPNCSYIYLIDLLVPLKDAVLEHLDYGSKPPDRTAHVVIVRGDLPSSRVEEYHVGPLPFPSYHIKVTNPSYTKSNIPYNSKPVDDVEYRHLYKILLDTTEILYPLLIESYGMSYHNCTTEYECIVFQDISPRGTNEKERQSWFGAYRNVEGYHLHPLGLEIQIDHSSRNVQNWYVYRIVYNGHFAYSANTLMERFFKGRVKLVKYFPLDENIELFSSLLRRGGSEMETPMSGPTMIEPDGRRYKVDGLHVSYMKWNLNFRMRASSGLQLFDIRFNDERIAYELSFQETATFYSGYGPLADLLNIYGNSYMMGASSSELIPGVDCPKTSTFLDTDHFVNSDKPFRLKNTICIFEDNANIPLRRHYARSASGKFQSYGGLENYRLIIRAISSIRNYDYIFDYVFYLNGILESKVSISGYLQTAFPLPHELKYGTYIHNNVVANIHQHLFHYKIDLDINGRTNRYATYDIGTENIQRQWYNDKRKQQLIYKKTPKRDEYDANFVSKSENAFSVIYNRFTSSKFGSPRGYRIVNNNEVKFLLENSTITRGATWAKFPLAITKFQDTELMSTSIYNGNGPWNPVVDFERFLKNNDTVRDTDIVAWLTLGINHIPHTEDVPTVTTVGTQASFYLMPFNFFTECPSMSSNNAIHMSVEKGTNKVLVNTFGIPRTKYCVQNNTNCPISLTNQYKSTTD